MIKVNSKISQGILFMQNHRNFAPRLLLSVALHNSIILHNNQAALHNFVIVHNNLVNLHNLKD